MWATVCVGRQPPPRLRSRRLTQRRSVALGLGSMSEPALLPLGPPEGLGCRQRRRRGRERAVVAERGRRTRRLVAASSWGPSARHLGALAPPPHPTSPCCLLGAGAIRRCWRHGQERSRRRLRRAAAGSGGGGGQRLEQPAPRLRLLQRRRSTWCVCVHPNPFRRHSPCRYPPFSRPFLRRFSAAPPPFLTGFLARVRSQGLVVGGSGSQHSRLAPVRQPRRRRR